jgi:tetratricopeptide (TPR) repeat protein
MTFTPSLPAVALSGVRHEYQKWNNCGPVTIGMQLSYFGRPETQVESAPFLKPNSDDKNVNPEELAAYARSLGFDSRVVVGGDLQLLKLLLSNKFPVIVESWFIPEPDDEMGHYLLLTGYDDGLERFIAYDSYKGPEQEIPYDELDRLWQVFNRTLILSYPPEQDRVALEILGERAEPERMYERALTIALEEARQDPGNKFAWFNIGSNAVALGRMEQAAQAFDQARTRQLPWRMLWYQFGPFQAYYALGRYEDVIALTTANLKATSNLEENAYWRGLAYAALNQPEAARLDFELALRDNKKFIMDPEIWTRNEGKIRWGRNDENPQTLQPEVEIRTGLGRAQGREQPERAGQRAWDSPQPTARLAQDPRGRCPNAL